MMQWKTHTCYNDQVRSFYSQRSDGTSGACHPHNRVVFIFYILRTQYLNLKLGMVSHTSHSHSEAA